MHPNLHIYCHQYLEPLQNVRKIIPREDCVNIKIIFVIISLADCKMTHYYPIQLTHNIVTRQ